MKNANVVINWIAGAAVVATVAAWGLIGGSAEVTRRS